MKFKVSNDYLDAFHRLRSLVSYNPDTGIFTHKTRPPVTRGDRIFNSKFAGRRAGGVDKSTGYRVVCLDGVRWYEHRLAFALEKGFVPDFVDRENGVRDDNRWLNLREATKSVNCRNAAMPSHNTSGFVGVAFVPRLKKWRAEISLHNRTKVLGHFMTLEDALRARRQAETENGFSRRHGCRASS